MVCSAHVSGFSLVLYITSVSFQNIPYCCITAEGGVFLGDLNIMHCKGSLFIMSVVNFCVVIT